jgi:[NiFe] hydrogenase assembly HybE family chaperone
MAHRLLFHPYDDKPIFSEAAVIQACTMIEGLERAFRAIHEERMQGLPILNPALAVEAVGFQALNGHCAGVLITPWFMNLMVLPPEGDSWQGSAAGANVPFEFPAGPREMMLCEEELLGHYLSESLFSPMSAFADQSQAVATAEKVVEQLMTTPPAVQEAEAPQPARRALLRGLFSAGRG